MVYHYAITTLVWVHGTTKNQLLRGSFGYFHEIRSFAKRRYAVFSPTNLELARGNALRNSELAK